MKVSVILIDWSVRESFHSVEYLNKQECKRNDYEIIWVEYFSRVVPQLKKYAEDGKIDKYLILGNNEADDYDKHRSWNEGVSKASGDILVFCDSDAIFKDTFIKNIINFFEEHDNAFLHLDEIRSFNKRFWPFNFPEWEEVMKEPEIYNWDYDRKITVGLNDECTKLPIFNRVFLKNYGACLCVKRNDFIRFGGFDEHETYTGYICGPYELSFRMINGGVKEYWHYEEFLLHTYHPWINARVDRIGPHINTASTTALKHICDDVQMPYVQNSLIRSLKDDLYTKKIKSAKVDISFICIVDNEDNLHQRLFDSICEATKKNFELIFVGNYIGTIEEDNVKYVSGGDSFVDSLLIGVENCNSKNIVIVPSNGIFRTNAIEQIIEANGDLVKPILRLNTIETFNDGVEWNISKKSNDCAMNWCMAVNINNLKQLLTENKTIYQLNNLVYELEYETDKVGLEIWHSNRAVLDSEIEKLINKMVELEFSIQHENKTDRIKEAMEVLDEILKIEMNNPGKFFKYCLNTRYSIIDYYRFVGVFRTHKINEAVINGLSMLIDNAPLTKKKNYNVDELNKLQEQWIFRDSYFIGSSYFHIARLKLEQNEIDEAVYNLKNCIRFIPEHVEAKRILSQIS